MLQGICRVLLIRLKRFVDECLDLTLAPPNARPQRQALNRCFSRSAGTASGAASAAGRWLGHRPRALLASTVRGVPIVSAALVTVRLVPSVPQRILLSERVVRQRQENAEVKHPAFPTRQDRASAAREIRPFMLAALLCSATASS